MTSEQFWQPRFVGKRFEDHSLPLQVLRDLTVLEEFLYATAIWFFRKENPDRKRTPKGFRNSVGLSLKTIEAGSARPALVLNDYNPNELFPSEGVRFFKQAKTAITAVIQKASESTLGSFDFPEHLLRYFDQLGRGMREDEYIEFAPETPQKPARLTGAVRKKLVAASNAKEFTQDLSVRGKVPEADLQKSTFTILSTDGKRIEGKLSDQIKQEILSAFNNYEKGAKVLVHGIASFSKSGVIKEFCEIEFAESLDELDVAARLEEIALLSDGWLDGKGIGFRKEQLVPLISLFDHCYPDALALPYLYPTAEGGIQAEWDTAAKSIAMEIELSGLQAEYRIFNKSDEGSLEKQFKLSETKDWDLFLTTLAKDLESSR